MALFGLKKKTGEKETKTAVIPVEKVSVISNPTGFFGSDIIVRPRITEKSHTLAENCNVYIFNVKQGATKGMVSQAIKRLYKVTPRKVAIVSIPKKRRFVRGKVGTSGGGRKAYVHLKKGEKLEIS